MNSPRDPRPAFSVSAPATPTRAYSYPSAEAGPGPSTSAMNLSLKSGTSRILGSLKRSFSAKAQAGNKQTVGHARESSHHPSHSTHELETSAATAPTPSQIAMGLHLSRTPHIPARLEAYSRYHAHHHPHHAHHHPRHHPHPHPHPHHSPRPSSQKYAAEGLPPRHSYESANDIRSHDFGYGNVDPQSDTGAGAGFHDAVTTRRVSNSTIRASASGKKRISTSLPPPPSRSAMKKKSVPAPIDTTAGLGDNNTSGPSSSLSGSGSLTTLESFSALSGTTAASLTGSSISNSNAGTGKMSSSSTFVGKLGLSRLLSVKSSSGSSGGRSLRFGGGSGLEGMKRERDGRSVNGSEGSFMSGGSGMSAASAPVKKAVRFDFVDLGAEGEVGTTPKQTEVSA